MNPSRARNRLTAYLEDDLSAREREKIEATLAASPELREELAELQRMVELLHSLPRPEAPPALASLVMARVRAGEAEPATLRNWLAAWLEPRYAVPVAATALALVVFVDMRAEPAVETAAPPPAQVAEASKEPAAQTPNLELAAAEMWEMRRESLQRRVRRHGVARLLRGAGHPHSAAFASDIGSADDVALVGFNGR